MDKKTFGIVIFAAMAVVLGVANLCMRVPSAQANVVIAGRDYQAVTVKAQRGGDALYILDNKTAQLAVFTYDPTTRVLRSRAVRFVADAFGGR